MIKYYLLALLLTISGVLAEPLSFSYQKHDMPEGGTMDIMEIRCDTNQFEIFQTGGWQPQAQPAQRKIQFTSTDTTTSIFLSLPLPEPENTNLVPILGKDMLVATLQKRFPNAKISSETPIYGSTKGMMFDVTRTSTAPLRVAFLPYQTGIAEFYQVSPPDKFESDANFFMGIVTSFAQMNIKKKAKP